MKQCSPAEFAASIPDGATIGVAASGGGLLEPDEVLAAIESRFLATGHPRDLTLVSALGFGDKDVCGLNRFAHETMIKRVICGHWSWSPRLQKLARDNKIEAYSLPGGVITLLLRACGAGQPGLITRTGMGTFVDPELQGGRINAAARDPIVERITVGGETFLRYLPIKLDFALIKGTYADKLNNVSLAEEPADLDTYGLALNAHNNGGTVVAQVRAEVSAGSLSAREVTVPGILVDKVVLCPDQPQTRRGGYSADYPGRAKSLARPAAAKVVGAKRIISLRAAAELEPGASINFGFGASAGVAEIIAERGDGHLYWATIEQGIHGGAMETSDLFGMAVNPLAIVPSAHQFDFYQGGGIDITFLGMAECDRAGNVNVSHFGDDFTGPGGFIDISQNAKKVVFCGTFDTAGTRLSIVDASLRIDTHGKIQKFVDQVAGVTFSGKEARRSGQTVLYVTERAVFSLTEAGVELIEVAPGIDIATDIVARMGFEPIINSPRLMDARCFA